MTMIRPLLAAALLGGGAISGVAAAGTHQTRSSAASCGATTPRGTGSPLTMAKATNQFGLNLYDTLAGANANTNVFISPASAELALAMAYDGARGGTGTAMAQTLGLQDLSTASVRRQAASLLTALASGDPKARLEIANSLWARAGIRFRQRFLQDIRQDYGAKVADLDFKSPSAPTTINAWVSCATHATITSIVDRIPSDALMYLINAVYFKGDWSNPFPSAMTHAAAFTTGTGAQRTQLLMHQTGTFPYYAGPDFQLISLPYGAGRFSMVVLLPRAGQSLAGFRGRLTPANWSSWLSRLHNDEGTIALPRFTLHNSFSLNGPLKRLGMGPALRRSANFSGICTQRCRLTQVLHKTYLEVDEKGTTAAAVTSVTVGITALHANPFQMIVNHPFFLAIRDSTTGVLLFFGGINDPQAG